MSLVLGGCGSTVIPTGGPATPATSNPTGSSLPVPIVSPSIATATPGSGATPADQAGIHVIKHVVMVMQENRSFDTYFGTYPGALGIPMSGGVPAVCVPDPATGACVKPFHNTADKDSGGPHGAANAVADIDKGSMDGFVGQVEHAKAGCAKTLDPSCAGSGPIDVMGYMDRNELPNYWAYADQFVLQDHMFEPDASWSLPAHLFMVSAWSATCADPKDPLTCKSNIKQPGLPTATNPQPYAWTDLTYLLYKAGVSWGYYLSDGTAPDCEDDAMACKPTKQSVGSPSIWNPLPGFSDVNADGQRGNIQSTTAFLSEARAGTLPAVSWVVPSGKVSEHHRDLPGLGRLGWLLRQRHATGGRRERLRAASTRPGDQPIRPARLHRPPGPELRRVPEVHRGRFPRWRPAGSIDRRPARRPPGRAGERLRVGKPRRGLRLHATCR